MKIHLLIQSTKANGEAARWVGRADLRQAVAVMPAQAYEKLSVEVRSFPEDGAHKPPATRRLTARRVGEDLVLEWGDQDVLRVVDFYRTPGAELGELELSQAAPGAHWAGPVADQTGTQTDVLDNLSERVAASPGASVEGGAAATTASTEVTLVPVLLPVPNLLPGILGLAGLAAVGSGGSGSENVSQGTTPAVFIVRFDAAASTVSFEGAVTGDISVVVNAGSASFVRGGVTAETTVSGLFNLATAPLIKLDSGQNLIVDGVDIHNQSIRVEGRANAHVTIRATDAGPTETTQLSAVVKVSLQGGTLTFDMTDDQQDTFTLLAQSAIDLAGGTLVVSDGVVDARNVSLTQLTNIGNIILNSELVVTLAQFDGLYEKLDVAKSQGDLVLAIASTEVTEAATVATLNNIRAGAITKTTVSIEALTSDGASAVATALVQKLAPTATLALTDTGVQRLDKVEALQATLGTDRKLDISKVAALEGTPEQIEQIFTSTQVTGLESKPVVVLEAQPLSVDAVNALAQRTGGRVTATISTGLMSELAALDASNGTAHAYKITLTDTEVDAGALKALYGKTSEAVNAESVTTLTGSAADIVLVYQSSGKVTGLGHAAVFVTDDSIAADTANTIAGLTGGVVTATVAADTAANLKAALTGETGADALTLTVSDDTAPTAAADLIALAGKSSAVVDAKAVTAVTGNSDQIAALYALAATDISGLGNEAVHVTGEVSAATVNSIAGLTDGVVTATVTADTAANLKAALSNASATDALTLTVSDSTGPTAAADLITLAGKTSVALDAKAVTAMTGNSDQITALYALAATDISGLGNEAVHVTGEVSAATANSIAGLTDGVVTATVTADTAANLKAALSNASATDALTLTVSDSTGPTAAADLITLAGKTSVALDAKAVTAVTGNADQIAALYALGATDISGLGNEAVQVTGEISAETANTIAGLTEGVATATVGADTAVNLTAALKKASATDALTLTVSDSTGPTAAADLITLAGKTSVALDAKAVTAVTGNADQIAALYALGATDISGLGNEAVHVTGEVSAATVNSIAGLTDGVVTATVAADTAANLKAGLNNASATDALTLTVSDSTGPTAAADLITLAGKTSVALDAKAVTAVTGNADQIAALYALGATDISGLGNEAVHVTGEISAETANTIAGLTEGVATATVGADTAVNLKAALSNASATDALTLTVSAGEGATAAADLITLAGKTSVALDAKAVTAVTGNAEQIAALYALAATDISGLGNEAVHVTGEVSAATANSIAGLTDGVVTATVTADTAANLKAALSNASATDALTLTVSDSTGPTAAADLITLAGKTSAVVDAKAVTAVTGNADQIAALYALGATDISGLGNEAVHVTGEVSAATANSIAGLTDGVVTATVTADTAANLKAALTGETGADALTLTVSDSTGPTAATDLIALAGKTTAAVNAVAVASLSGARADVAEVLTSTKITTSDTANSIDLSLTDKITVAQANGLNAVAAVDQITATISTGLMSELAALDASNGTAHAYKITLTDTEVDAGALKALYGKTSEAVNAESVTTLTGSAADIVLVYQSSGKVTGLGHAAVFVTDDSIAADTANTIAGLTGGVVTATVAADTAANLKAALTGETGADALTLTVSDDTAPTAAADLIALAGKSSAVVDAKAVTAVTGNSDQIAALYALAATDISGLGNEAVHVTGEVSAATVNSIAGLTDGVVTATVTADTAANLKAALSNASATDALTLTVSDSTGPTAAADLITLAGKTSVALDAKAVTAMTGNSDQITALYALAATDISGLGNEAVHVTGEVSAATANSIAGLTDGVVTATVTADTAANLKAALSNASATDALTLTVSDSTGPTAAADLITLAGKTSVALDAKAVTAVTGNADQIAALYALGATDISGLGNEAVQVTGEISAETANTIAGLTEGVATATVGADTAVNLTAALKKASATDALTLTVSDSTGPTAAADLITLAGKTSVALDAKAVTAVTGNADQIAALYALGATDISGLGNEAVHVTGEVSAATVNSIAGLTDGVVTATVAADTAANLKAGLNNASATDALTLTVSDSTGPTAAADLITLAGKTSVALDAKAVTAVTGNADQIAALYALGATDISGLGNEAVHVTGEISAETANTIAGLTEGVATATVGADTAVNLKAALSNASATDALTLTVSAGEGATAAADLITLAGKTSVALDAKAVTAVTGNAEQIAALYALAATDISGLGNEAVHVTGEVSAATANSIAGLTDGVVTATVAADTAVNLKAALKNASATDALTLTVSAGEGATAAADLIALTDKTSRAVNAEEITDLSGTAEQIQALYDRKVVASAKRESAATDGEVAKASAATGIAGLGDEKVLVTDDSIAAVTASAIAGLTEGAVTATVDAATASHLLTALGAATVNDAFLLTVLDDEAGTDAVELTALLSKTSVQVNAHAVMALKGDGAAIRVVYQSMGQLSGLGKETVTVLGSTDVATANAIAQATTGTVTATVEAATAAQLVDALNTENAKLSLALTVSAGAAAAADLITLAVKTSVAVDAQAVTAVTGNAEQIKALYGLLSTDILGLGNEAVSVSGEINAETANTIAGLTEGVVTATVAEDTAENLKAALTGETGADALTLTVSDSTGPTAATDLIALAGKTTAAVNAVAVASLSGARADVAEVLTSTKITTSDTTNSIDVSITDPITVEQANGLNAVTAVDQITATISTGLMSELAALDASNGTAHAYKITLTDTEVDAGALKALYDKTSEAVNAESVTTLTGSAADIVLVYQSSGEVMELGNEAVRVSGVISAEQAAAMATRTSGQVTATVDLNLGEGSFDEKVTALLDALTASGSDVPEVNAFVFRHLPSDANETSLAKLQSLSSLVFDRTRPSLEIVTTLGADTTANGDVTYVFSFDEAVVDFDTDDIAVLNGEKGLFTATTEGEQANRRFTLVVQPTPDTQGQSIQLTVGTDWTDLAGNAPAGVSTAPLQPFDTLAPGLTITSDYETLNGDEEAQVTFTFQDTETVSNFDISDIVVYGGRLGALTGSDTTYTAIFTPEANFEGTARISVAAGGFTDTAGNANTVAASHSLTVDTRAPTLSISNDQAPGSTAKGQVTYIFTFSEAVSGFDIDDITVNGGTPLELVSTTTGSNAGKVYTLVVVPPTNTAEGILELSVGNVWYDALGNRPAIASTSATPQPYDTLPPAGVVGSLKVTADNTVNSDESGQDTLAVTGQVTGEFTVGNSVFITVNGQTYQDIVDDTDGNFSVNVAVSDLLDAATGTTRSLSATAVLTDAAGNRFTTPEVTHSFALDQVAPEITSAGTIFIREHAGSSVFYAATHSATDFDHWALVSGLGDDAGLLQVNPGDGRVTLQGGGDLIYGQNDSQYKFTLRAFDKAGNHSDQAVTVKVLDLPEVSLTNLQVGGEDNIVNAEESSGDEVRVTATIVGDIGTRSTYTVENTIATLEINSGEAVDGRIEGNTVVFDVSRDWVLDGDIAAVKLTLSIRDALSATGLHSVPAEIEQAYTVDIALTGTVTDVKVTADNVVNLKEFSVREGEQLTDTLTVTGRVTGEFAKDDLVTLFFDGPSYTGRVDEEGRFSIDVLKVDVRGNNTRSVTVSVERHDGAGNVGTTTTLGHTYTFDVESPLVTLDALSATAVSDSTPTVTGRVTDRSTGMAGVVVTLTVFDEDGNALSGSAFTGLSVTTDDLGNFSKELPTLPASGNYRVVASTAATDAAGNPALSGETTAIYSPVIIGTTGDYGFDSAVVENTTGWQLDLSTSGGAAGATYTLQMEIDPSKSPDLSKFTLSGNTLVFTGSTDYESFASADGDNTYQITLHAEDGKDNSVDQVVRFSLNNLGPVFQGFTAPADALTSSDTSASVILAPTDLVVATDHYQLDQAVNAGAGWTSWVGGAITPLAGFMGVASTTSLGGALRDSRSAGDLLTFSTSGVEGGLQLSYTLNPDAIAYKALRQGESLSVPVDLWVRTAEPGAANEELTRVRVPVTLSGQNDAPTVEETGTPVGWSSARFAADVSIAFDDLAYGVGAFDWDASTNTGAGLADGWVDIAYFRVTKVEAGALTINGIEYSSNHSIPADVRITAHDIVSWQPFSPPGTPGNVAAFRVEAVDRQGLASSSTAMAYVAFEVSNLAPVAQPNYREVTEDSVLIEGNLIHDAPADYDPDGDEFFAARFFVGDTEIESSGRGLVGIFFVTAEGYYSYQLDERANALGEGDEVEDVLTYYIRDPFLADHSSTLTIKVRGVNDSAEIAFSGDQDRDVKVGSVEDATAGGQLSVADVDTGESSFKAASADDLQGIYGDFAFEEATGAWTYALDKLRPATMGLAEGASVEDRLTVQSYDGTPFEVVVSVYKTFAPVNTVPEITTAEDTPVAITGLSVGDADADLAATYTVILTVTNGTLAVASTVAGGLGTADIAAHNDEGLFAVTLTGTLAAINTTLSATNGVTFHPAEHFFSTEANPAVLTMSTDDGAGGMSASGPVPITVTAVNDAPTNFMPAPFSVPEESKGQFIPDLQIADVDSTGDFTVTLSVSNGTLHVVEDISGAASAYDSGNDTNTVTLQGTLDKINTTLADLGGVKFTPLPNFAGTATLTMTSVDSAGDSRPSEVAITVLNVNDDPTAENTTASATERGGLGNTTGGVNPSGNVLTGHTNDVDGDSPRVSSVQGIRSNGTGAIVDAGTAFVSRFGTLRLNADGSYNYTVNENTVQHLLPGDDPLEDIFTYSVIDGQGGSTTATLTVSIHGANDAVVLNEFRDVDVLSYEFEGGAAGAGAVQLYEPLSTIEVLLKDGDTDPLRAAVYTFKLTGGQTGDRLEFDPALAVGRPGQEEGEDDSTYIDRVNSYFKSVWNGSDTLTVTFESAAAGANPDLLRDLPFYLVRFVGSETVQGSARTVSATVTDSFGLESAPLTTTINVVDHVFVSAPERTSVNENAVYSTTLAMEGASGSVSWELVGGDDAGQFTLSGDTLGLAMKNFEQPDDTGGNRSYSVTVRGTDAGTGQVATRSIMVEVLNANDLPTGAPVISYTPAVAGARPSVGQVLTASIGTTDDEDGLGTLTYQWLRADQVIDDATSSTYTLVSADVGSAISVRARYTDGHGAAETVDSSATATVNKLPTTATGPVTSNTGTEDTVVVVTFDEIQSALGATDSDGAVAKFTVGSVTTGSLKIGATSESAMAFSSTNNAITADLNAYWRPGSNHNGLRDMFTVRAVDNDGAASSLAQLRATLASVNDAPRMDLVSWDDYSTTPYDPTDPAIAGNPVAYLMSRGAFPADPENNPITRIKIFVTSGLDSANDRLEVAATYINGSTPSLSVVDNLFITQYDPEATVNEVGPGELILTTKAGVVLTNSTWSEFLQLVVMRSQPGAAAGDRVFAIELTDAPGGTLTPLTTVVTSFAGSPFVVTVAASVPELASEAPVAQPAGWVGVDGHDPLAGLLPSSSDYVLSGTTESFALFSAADAAQFGHDGQAFIDGNGGGMDVFAYNLTTGAIGLVNHSAAAGHLVSSGSAVSNVTLSGKHVFFTAADATQFGNGGQAFADQDTVVSDLFAFNLDTGWLQLISSVGDGQTAAGGHDGASFAGSDGTYAYFTALNATPTSFADVSSTTTADLHRVLLA